MRITVLLAGVLLVAACSDNNNKEPVVDMNANADLPLKIDMAGGGAACDVIKQDCPAGQKCTVLQTGTGQNASFAAGCIVSDANIAAGMPCIRNNETVGDDACDKGLFCTGVGYPVDSAGNPMRHCNPLCTADSACGSTQRCETLTDAGDAGLCVTSCQPFSTTCDTGLTCTEFLPDIDSTQQNFDLFFTCRAIGMGGDGDGCNADTDCGADYICDQTGACSKLCDDSHACPTASIDGGLACSAFDPSSSLGSCE